MTTILLKGNEVEIEGSFLKKGDLSPDFILCTKTLENVTLENYSKKKKVIATLPSLDTPVCSQESKEISLLATKYPSVVFIIISRDSPFALTRFCKSAEMNNVITLSDIRTKSNFAKNYGVKIASGPLDGLLARSVIVFDESDNVIYSELVNEITSLPDFKLLENTLGEIE